MIQLAAACMGNNISPSALSQVDAQPWPQGGWDEPALEPPSKTEATLAASQARRHSMIEDALTVQLNPSETLLPCWEEASFLSNRSALSCCFPSGLSLASSEISSDMCSYPWEQDAHSVK